MTGNSIAVAAMKTISHDTWLFLCRKPPYGSAYGNACMELLLTAATFGRKTVLAFTDDGIFHLVKGQAAGEIGMKDLSAMLPALELYEVSVVLVTGEALEVRNLSREDLAIPVETVSRQTLANLMESAAQVLSF